MYGSCRKVVDLLALYRGETYAIEIKSAKDDLRRLLEQISEYSKIFDHTLLFTTKDHLPKIKKIQKIKYLYLCSVLAIKLKVICWRKQIMFRRKKC